MKYYFSQTFIVLNFKFWGFGGFLFFCEELVEQLIMQGKDTFKPSPLVKSYIDGKNSQ